MRSFTREELRTLLDVSASPSVSLFAPMELGGPDTRQNPIRFKNALRSAQQQLAQNGMRAPEVERFLKPAQRLLEDEHFWQHQREGLAVFMAADHFLSYALPIAPRELAVVGRRFYVKPLLPLLQDDGRFYVLALSQNRVRLLECTRDTVSELRPEHVPTSMAEALKYEVYEQHLQFHTGAAAPEAGVPPHIHTGVRPAMFHGHGGGHDDRKDRVLRFFQQVNRGIDEVLHEQQAPLLLAGVEYLFPIYREVNSYPHLLAEGLSGNSDEISAAELHRDAKRIMQKRFELAYEQALTQYGELKGADRVSNRIETLVVAAFERRIAVLFLATGAQVWGSFDPEAVKVELHPTPAPGDEDLLDYVALHTLVNRGTVYAVPPAKVPDGGPAAAMLRY